MTGEPTTYYYAWRGGPRLAGKPGDVEFVTSYHDAHASNKRVRENEFLSVIADYKKSSDFLDLGERTRDDYLKCMKHIEDKFASMPIAALNEPRVTKVFLNWRDGLEISPKWKDYCLSVLFMLIAYARRCGLTNYTPPTGIKKLYRSDRADAIWLPPDIRAFAAAAKLHVWRAFVLAIETGQRQGDIIRLPWSSYVVEDGRAWIRLVRDRREGTDTRQRKTRAAVLIPCTSDLRAILDETPRIGKMILVNSEGQPWTSGAIQKAMGDAKRRAGIEGLTFHDLRGTAVTRLAEAGCTNAEISSITGHSLESVATILKTYLGMTKGLALAAIGKLEQKRAGGSL